VDAGGAYSRHFGPQLSAAISYHVLFSLFPLAITLVSIGGLILQNDARRESFTNWVLDNVPLAQDAGVDLASAIEGLAGPLSAAGLIALAGLIWSASGMMAAIRRGLDAAFAEGIGRPIVQAKLVDFLLVLGTGLVVLAAIGLSILTRVVQDLGDRIAGPDVVGETLKIVEPIVLAFMAFLFMYRHVPVAKPKWRYALPGALVAAIGFEIVTVGFSFYLANFGRYNVVYGSLGAALAFLVAVYLNATVFLFGAELAAAWPRTREASPPTGPDEHLPVGNQIVGFLKGLVVRGKD
jgi:membrane protein